jgi:hypothetical protein
VHDELLDVTTLILGLRSEALAMREWPTILGGLGRIRDRIWLRRPERRRSPALAASADWLHRTLREAPIADGVRAEALEVLATIKEMVGPVVVKEWLLTRENGKAEADRADPTESDASPVEGGRRKPAEGGVTGPKYFTNVGPRSGPILWRDDHAAIDVLRNPGDFARIGTARPVGRTEGGIAIWEITNPGKAVFGRWIVLGREFLPRK